MGVLVLVDKDTLESSDCLVEMNLCLRSLWAATSVVLKPWTDRTDINRMQDSSIPTASIPVVADTMLTAAGKLAKLLRTSNRLICLHESGKAVANGPRAPPSPNLEVMMSTEVDSYFRVVHEADTAEEAIALWRPGPVQPSHLKGHQQGPNGAKGAREASKGEATEVLAVTAANVTGVVVVATDTKVKYQQDVHLSHLM